MKDFINHAKIYIFRGILAIIPLMLSWFALRFIYVLIDQRASALTDHLGWVRIPGLGLFLVLCTLYFIGLTASNVVGRNFFNLLEGITNRIPLIKTIYQVGKQVSYTLSLPEKQVFQRVVLVDYFKPGVWIIGFVTGTIVKEGTDEKLLKVFIPTVPNPTSGLLVMLRESETIDPEWSVEEAMKTVVSGGIIGPQKIHQHRSSN
ncbi:MAG: DUF502 domain-containing protein [Candidatus Omnitrophica bacterium]|nr:DUF502 domain-containing protein [Candidatus Omnitrophota bacterium]